MHYPSPYKITEEPPKARALTSTPPPQQVLAPNPAASPSLLHSPLLSHDLTLFPAGRGREQGSKKQHWDCMLSIPAGTATEQVSGKLTVGPPHKGWSSSLPFHRAGSWIYIPDRV